MHDALLTPRTSATTAAPRSTGPVLVAGGRATGTRLLELARWTGAADAGVSVLLPHAPTLLHGEAALAQLSELTPEDAPLSPPRLLSAIVEARATTLVLAYPADAQRRADFALALQRLRDEVDLDMIVYFERHQRPWRRILVPYLSASLDAAAFQLATRSSAAVTLLHAVERDGDADPALLRAELEQLHRCTVQVVEADDPLAAAAAEARWDYDLVVIGGGHTPLPGRSFTMRQQRLLLATDLSLVVVHSAA